MKNDALTEYPEQYHRKRDHHPSSFDLFVAHCRSVLDEKSTDATSGSIGRVSFCLPRISETLRRSILRRLCRLSDDRDLYVHVVFLSCDKYNLFVGKAPPLSKVLKGATLDQFDIYVDHLNH